MDPDTRVVHGDPRTGNGGSSHGIVAVPTPDATLEAANRVSPRPSSISATTRPSLPPVLGLALVAPGPPTAPASTAFRASQNRRGRGYGHAYSGTRAHAPIRQQRSTRRDYLAQVKMLSVDERAQ